MATPGMGMGGVGMNVSMSDLGMTASGGQKRNEDEERRAKLRKVLRNIGTRKGRVSEEGIARVGRRAGFDNNFDLDKETGNRTISSAGTKLIIDVVLKGDDPQKVQIMFDTENEQLTAQAEPAAKVLLDDLRPVGGPSLITDLDNYAANLGRLAKIDRLCKNQVNCFEALTGIHVSLQRLYEQERKGADDSGVMRKKSGRPTMNAHGRLGLDLEYWQTSMTNESKSGDSMEVDSDAQAHDSYDGGDVHRLRISIERSPAGLYPPIRLSDNWLPSPLELEPTDLETATSLPWQDPPLTFVPNAAEPSNPVSMHQQRQPDLRFIAKLEPALVLPYQVASTLSQSVGLPAPNLFVAQAWHALLLNPSSSAPFENARDSKPTSADQRVLTMRGNAETEVTHRYTLDAIKADMAFKLEELPFSHPRQLVEILPTLRQWAFFSSMIRGAMVPDGPSCITTTKTQTPLNLADLLTTPITPPETAETLSVSLSVVTSPAPSLSLVFPSRQPENLARVAVQVGQNADVAIISRQGINDDLDDRAIIKALELCGGDLGVWVEWLRSR